MSDVYIKKIEITKVRHLENITIDLSNEKKHLIITGKNGSGKTSLILAIQDNLNRFFHNRTKGLSGLDKMKHFQREKEKLENELKNISDESQIRELQVKIDEYKKDIDEIRAQIGYQIRISFNNENLLTPLYRVGDFIFVCFGVDRSTKKITIPKGIQNIEYKDFYPSNERPGDLFVQHLVNLTARKSFARDKGDEKTVKKIEEWFKTFQEHLKIIFEDEEFKLEFDDDKFNYKIIQQNKEKVNFNELADGHSSILAIILELMSRMTKKENYEIEGVVLIDEIETHLHVSLQKKILRFLTSIFPKMQFIVTTHSPFILNSIADAVIYDLEERIQTEDLSAYSYDGLVESYFEVDKYSDEIKNKINRYEELVTKDSQGEEKEEMYFLRKHLKSLPQFLNNDELMAKFHELELVRMGKERDTSNKV